MLEFNNDATRSALAVLPEILMTLLAIAVIFVDVYTPASKRRSTGYLAGIGMFFIAAIALVAKPTDGATLSEQLVLGGMIRTDALASIFSVMVILTGGLTCLMGMGDERLRYKGEFFAMIIIATTGASLLSAAADLVMIFLALETVSISLYALAGFIRPAQPQDPAAVEVANRSAESSVKYFLFGAFSTAFFLYGLSLLYGFTGETNIYNIGQVLGAGGAQLSNGEQILSGTAPIIFALIMVGVGFGFKVSAVPFHFWTPDVYEGAPTPVTSYISVASKAASFAVMARFLLAVFPPDKLLESLPEFETGYSEWWVQLFAILAVVTMTLGNVLALSQQNIKRMIAYSSIAQAGYTLIGLVAISTTQDGQGVAAVAFYMFMYAMTNTLMFATVLLFTNATGSETIRDMAGLSRRNPWIALGMTIALLSLAGIPPTAGFIGKILIFRAAVDSGLAWLAMFGFLNSIVALYYYLVVVKVIYVDRSEHDEEPIALPAPYGFVVAATSIAVVLLGTFLTSPMVDWANEAGEHLFFALIGK